MADNMTLEWTKLALTAVGGAIALFIGCVLYGTTTSGSVVKLVKFPAFRPYTRARVCLRAYGINVSKFTNFTTWRGWSIWPPERMQLAARAAG